MSFWRDKNNISTFNFTKNSYFEELFIYLLIVGNLNFLASIRNNIKITEYLNNYT